MSTDHEPYIKPEVKRLFEKLSLERQVVRHQRCDCGGSLDTGYACLDCGRDYAQVAFAMPEDRWWLLAAGT